MGTKIILLSDGTGNTPNKVWRTNVWRIFQSLDRTNENQLALYDDGVGTSSFPPAAWIGGIFGWGLKRNVIHLYKFICRNYKSNNDEIFAFGFSRGAFTIRVLIGLVNSQGLVAFKSEHELNWKAEAAYRAYRSARPPSIFRVERLIYRIPRLYRPLENRPAPEFKFVGLWDTVAAYGLPVESMTRGLSRWFWPLELPSQQLPKNVLRACHALSLDDERRTFHPVLWDEQGVPPAEVDAEGRRYTASDRVSQVWFAGSHANVGGGYPDNSLAQVSLSWVLEEARQSGLAFNSAPDADPDALASAMTARDRDGRIYNSRKGLRAYYRYGPRKISELYSLQLDTTSPEAFKVRPPKIHESVFQRMLRGAHPYAPIAIPAKYEVVTDKRQILTIDEYGFETSKRAMARSQEQERVWDLVWQRSVINYATVITVFSLLFFPFVFTATGLDMFVSPFKLVSDFVRILGTFLPSNAWINAFARAPEPFLVLVVVLLLLRWRSLRLKTLITDKMHLIWNADEKQQKTPPSTSFAYHLRTSPLLLGFRRPVSILSTT